MEKPQIIHTPKGEELVVLPRAEYNRLLKAKKLERNPQDVVVFDEETARIKSGATVLFPREVVNAMLDEGKHPVRAWREYRGLTAERLAKKAKLLRTTVTQIETRKYKGTVKAYQAIARALDVNIDNVVE